MTIDWIAEVRKRRDGNHANPEETRFLRVAPFAIGLEYRRHAGNLGYCIHVYGIRDGLEHERLRIDCFDKVPHFHREWSSEDIFIRAPETALDDPWEWGLDVLDRELVRLGYCGDVALVQSQLRHLSRET